MSALRQWANGVDLTWLLNEAFVVITALIALTVHEFSHAWAAMRLGDDTARRFGRLSLNPLRHLSPSGILMLAVLGFGWAKPVPVNMRRFRNPKAGMALTSLAGPLSNVLLALLGCIGYQATLAVIWSRHGGLVEQWSAPYCFAVFFHVFASLNAGLAVFNLIPISPLDGSKVLAIILPDRAHAWLMRYERYGMFLLIALLLLDVLTVPLQFLRQGLLDGLTAFVRLFLGGHPNEFYIPIS